MSFARTDSGGNNTRGGRRGGSGSFAATARPVAGGSVGGPTGFRPGLPAAPDPRNGRRGGSGSFGEPAERARPVVPTLGGGGGGGGGMAQAIPTPAMSLEDYIQNHFMLKQAEREAARGLEDYDAQTMKLQQDTEAEQMDATQSLERTLADQGQENAGSFAARGLDRSGLVFQEQDRINERGQQGKSRIAQMLTDLLANRGQGRIDADRNNQSMINDRIAKITEEFNQRNMGQIGV